MPTYNPERITIPTTLDEHGLKLGLRRFPSESLSDYRRRLLLEIRAPSGPTQDAFIQSISRRVGAFDTPVARIDLVRDADGIPDAVDPYIEVSSGRLILYSDYENNTIDSEINLFDRTSGYFLQDIYDVIDTSVLFTIEILDADSSLYRSKMLRYGNSRKHIVSEVTTGSMEYKLRNNLISRLSGTDSVNLVTEVFTLADVDAIGKYYIDYINGIIFTASILSGFLTYTYNQFPYDLIWQSVRAYPYIDADKQYQHCNALISDTTGQEEYTILNSHGSLVANDVLAVHALSWGE